MNIFHRGNLTNNEKASMLETVGNQFRRDAILKPSLNAAKSSLNNINTSGWSESTKNQIRNLTNLLIKLWSKEINDIPYYGKIWELRYYLV